MRNALQSSQAFAFDPREQLAVWREMEARNEAPLVLYHSHTASRAYPSREDLAFAIDPAPHYLIASTADPSQPELRSFRMALGHIVEETLVIRQSI